MGLYLAIDPKYQGKGIGTELLRQAEHLSATLGCTRLTLICEDHLIPLYKKLGYTLDGINALKYGNKTWYDMSIETKNKRKRRKSRMVPITQIIKHEN